MYKLDAATPVNAGAALALVFFLAAGLLRADNIVVNPSFEGGLDGWTQFVPNESLGQNCSLSFSADLPHSGSACGLMHTDGFARFGISPKIQPSTPMQSGDRYRVSLWVRAAAQDEVHSGTPGFLIRMGLGQGKVSSPGGNLFLGLDSQVSRGASPPVTAPVKLPQVWTKIEAVVEIPADADRLGAELFVVGFKGDLYVDDFAMEKVDASTALTPLTPVNFTPAPASPPAPTATAAAPAPAPAADAGLAPNPGQTLPATPGPVTTDDQALAELNLDAPGMDKVKAAAQSGDMAAVKAAYLDYRRTACPAKFTVMPSDEPPTATEQTDTAGDEVCNHYIRKLGYDFPFPGADMGKDFNWTYNPLLRTNPAFSMEWTFCAISRCQFFQTLADAYWKTHDEKYAIEWVSEMEDFAAKNPRNHDEENGAPALWRSLDTAGRVGGSWPYAYYHFLNSPNFDAKAQWIYLRSMIDQAERLADGLKDQNRSGNWVVAEASALNTAGVLFPELKDSGAWQKTATDRMILELNRVVPPDGFEAELTTGYHFLCVNCFLGPLQLAKLNNLPIPDIFLSKIIAMYRAPIWVMDQRGWNVPTNDSGPYHVANMLADALKLSDDPTLEWAASGGKKGTQPPDSTMLPYAGFYAMRGGWKLNDMFLFFRAGPPGVGHEHEDMLEVVMRAWNKTLLFDPGTYTYDHSDWRRYTIGTASHNTIIVDSKWQHRGENKPPVTDPVSNPWVTTPVFDYVAGTYASGYQLSVYDQKKGYQPQDWVGPVDHSVTHTRRVLFLKPYYALVLDSLDGKGTHLLDAHFHLDAPAAHTDPATQAAFSDNKENVQLGLYPLDRDNLKVDVVQGQKDPLLGWYPVQHRAIPTIRFRKLQALPATFATFLYPFKGMAPDFDAKPLAVTGDGVWGQSFVLPAEKAEVAIVKDGTSKAFSLTLPDGGNANAETAGLLLRKSIDGTKAFVGGWDLRSFNDGARQFSLDAPAAIVASSGGGPDKLLFYNAGDKAVTVTVAKPFAATAPLAPGQWTEVSGSGNQPASAPPALFPSLDAIGMASAARPAAVLPKTL
jgi:hypothetical protein